MEKKKELCRNCGARYARCKKCNERFCFRCAFKLGAYDTPYNLKEIKDTTVCPKCLHSSNKSNKRNVGIIAP